MLSTCDGMTVSGGIKGRENVVVVDLSVSKGKRWEARGNWSIHDGQLVADVLVRGGNRVRCRADQ
jgi:hypothetical protein